MTDRKTYLYARRMAKRALRTEEFISKGYVKCCVCFLYFESLSRHLGSHGITAKEYKLLHPGAKIDSERLSKNHADLIAERNRTPEIRELRSLQISARNLGNNYRWGDAEWASKARQQLASMRSRRLLDPEKRRAFGKRMSEIVRASYARGDHDHVNNSTFGNSTFYNGIWYRSGFEAEFAKLFDRNNCEFKYEPIKVPYEYCGKIGTYTPDFLLVKYNILLEIKPDWLHSNRVVLAKLDAAAKIGCDVRLAGNKAFKGWSSLFPWSL